MKEERGNEGKRRSSGPSQYYGLYFLIGVILLYAFLVVLEPENAGKSLMASGNLLVQIFPVLVLIVLIMGIMNYFVSPKAVSKHVGKGSGVKGWSLAVLTGILSHGPIYVWFPLLKELRDKGMRSGLVAVFLYNRAIKIPLLPVMVFYFGITYVAVLSIYMVVASIFEGKIIEMTEGQT